MLSRLLMVFVFGLLPLAVGCSDTVTRRFTIEVRNQSSKPVTLGLTKNGPPMEVYWETPTERAMMDPRNTGIGWGKVVPPGKSVYIDNLPGEFTPQTSAFLRIYVGALSLNDILAIGTDSRNRFDIRLTEGKSVFEVKDRGPFVDISILEIIPGGEEAKRNPAIRDKEQ